MIAKLKGNVIEYAPPSLVVDVMGIGYDVHLPFGLCPPSQKIDVGSSVDLFIRQIIREDSMTLYGFFSRKSRDLFDKLTEVKGCGPKLSQAILAELGDDSTVSAIIQQDAKLLKKVTGVGSRLAERIILELKGRLEDIYIISSSEHVASEMISRELSSDLIDALLSLGYRKSDCEKAIDILLKDQNDFAKLTLQDQIKKTLGVLRK